MGLIYQEPYLTLYLKGDNYIMIAIASPNSIKSSPCYQDQHIMIFYIFDYYSIQSIIPKNSKLQNIINSNDEVCFLQYQSLKDRYLLIKNMIHLCSQLFIKYRKNLINQQLNQSQYQYIQRNFKYEVDLYIFINNGPKMPIQSKTTFSFMRQISLIGKVFISLLDKINKQLQEIIQSTMPMIMIIQANKKLLFSDQYFLEKINAFSFMIIIKLVMLMIELF
ncbi:hypothetical protein pb186bvf_000113 [Paramecium bursaria]